MRFQVPQFIEVEDKVFGPLTLKQFIYLVGGAGLSFLIYILVDSFMLAIIPAGIIMAISGALAFFKPNKRPFINVVEAAFKYAFSSKLFIWKKEEPKPAENPAKIVEEAKKYAGLTVPKMSDSKLKDLAWSLDIKESIYSNKNQK